MNKIFLFAIVLLAACKQSTESRQELIYPNDTLTEQNRPGPTKAPDENADLFPDVSKKYAMRRYSDELQKELDERNGRRQLTSEIMTLVDAGIGQDVGYIEFRDAKGKKRIFAGWPDTPKLGFHETEDGEDLNDAEKGKKYQVIYALKAYWSDPGGEVAEDWFVIEMNPEP
jgi:hypothetical protein